MKSCFQFLKLKRVDGCLSRIITESCRLVERVLGMLTSYLQCTRNVDKSNMDFWDLLQPSCG